MSRRGAVLVLGPQAVPAKSLRVVQANTKSPRFHVHDYARVRWTVRAASPLDRATWLMRLMGECRLRARDDPFA